jgi:hypothetical protein
VRIYAGVPIHSSSVERGLGGEWRIFLSGCRRKICDLVHWLFSTSSCL